MRVKRRAMRRLIEKDAAATTSPLGIRGLDLPASTDTNEFNYLDCEIHARLGVRHLENSPEFDTAPRSQVWVPTFGRGAMTQRLGWT